MRLQKWLILGIVFSFLLVAPAFAQQGYDAKQVSVRIQRMDVYAATNLGQMLDNTRSYVIVMCDSAGTLRIFGHLQSTNQAGKLLNVWLSMDGCSPMMVASFTPNLLGNGDFYGIMACCKQSTCCPTTCCFGSHNIVVAIDTSPAPGATLYITHAPIQLKCP